MKNKPELIIVGGPNGVGKSTIALEYSSQFKLPYLSADEIAKKLKDEKTKNHELVAGRKFFKKLDEIS